MSIKRVEEKNFHFFIFSQSLFRCVHEACDLYNTPKKQNQLTFSAENAAFFFFLAHSFLFINKRIAKVRGSWLNADMGPVTDKTKLCAWSYIKARAFEGMKKMFSKSLRLYNAILVEVQLSSRAFNIFFHASLSPPITHIGPPEKCLRILTEVIKRFTNLIRVEAETDSIGNI